MKPGGETGKNGAKNAKPSDKPAASEHEAPDPAGPGPNPPSDSERAAAAKVNPLRPPGEAGRADAQDGSAGGPPSDRGEDPKSSTDATDATGAASSGAPELRISASMLSAQPPAASGADQPAPPPPGHGKTRRRVRRMATPIDSAVFNPLSLFWPRATSRKGARRASRYGLVGLIASLLWALSEVRVDTISKAVNFSSSAAAIAALIGGAAVLILIVIGYYYHSRIAALLSLGGAIALMVLQYRSPGGTSPLELVGQAVLVYMLFHGVYGTIAYHIYGRRKRRRSSRYRYKDH